MRGGRGLRFSLRSGSAWLSLRRTVPRHSRAPPSPSSPCRLAASRANNRDGRGPSSGMPTSRFEALRGPHLKLVAKADKSDLGSKPAWRAKRFRKDDASVAIDGENLDVAVKGDRQLVALVRIVRQACEKPIDLLRKSLAACIECRSIERGVAVDARRRSRRARARRGMAPESETRPLASILFVNVETKRSIPVCSASFSDATSAHAFTSNPRCWGALQVSIPPAQSRGAWRSPTCPEVSRNSGRRPCHVPMPMMRMGMDGITWDYMGVNGPMWRTVVEIVASVTSVTPTDVRTGS